MLRRKDLVWLLAWPIYQLLGTLRHEGSHAAVVLLQGGRVQEFVFWPVIRAGRGFAWGYVRWEGPVTWAVAAAPYLCDALTYALCFCLLARVAIARRWLRLNLAIVGLASPLVNSLYNYLGALRGRNDVAYLLRVLPAGWVHLFFVLSIAAYVLGLVSILRARGAGLPDGSAAAR
jgi:hypothetical protein